MPRLGQRPLTRALRLKVVRAQCLRRSLAQSLLRRLLVRGEVILVQPLDLVGLGVRDTDAGVDQISEFSPIDDDETLPAS